MLILLGDQKDTILHCRQRIKMVKVDTYEAFLNPTRSEYKYVSKISESILGVNSVRGLFSEGDIWIWRSDIFHNKFVKDLKDAPTKNIYFTIEPPELYIIANTSFMSSNFFKETAENPEVFEVIARKVKKFAPIKKVGYGIEGRKGRQFTI